MDGGFNHVGVGVGDINAAIGFYRDAFGCRALRAPFEVTGEAREGEEARNVLSSRPFKRMLLAHLVAPDGVGIELFQLIDPPYERRNSELEYWEERHVSFLHDRAEHRRDAEQNCRSRWPADQPELAS